MGSYYDSPRLMFKDARPHGRRRSWASKCRSGQCHMFVVAGLILGFFLFHLRGVDPFGEDKPSFVVVRNGRFEADCRPFRFVGFNTHDLVQAASMTVYEYDMKNGKSGRARVREMFREASAAGMSVVRTWVHTNDKAFPFQTRPGVYDESTLRSLDYILDEARQHGIHVILSLVDNWKYYNGVDHYVDWSETVPKRLYDRPQDKAGDPVPRDYESEEIGKYETERHALFFTDISCRRMFKNHIHIITNRRNHANGAFYKNDPTILAWDLINEPRCETWAVPRCGDHLQNWVEEMSSFLRSEDPNHLITIGSEGFFAHNTEHASHNPQDWAGFTGQDWIRNHALKNIDFMTIHVWPNNWNRTDSGFQDEWVRVHVRAAEELGKPLLLEEFGKKLQDDDSRIVENVRDPVYQQIYSIMEESMLEGKGVYGSLFWRWNMPLYDDRERGEYGVRPSDSTFDLVKMHATFVRSLTHAMPPGQCSLNGCWVPEESMFSRKCVNKPEVCQAMLSANVGLSDKDILTKRVNVSGQSIKLLSVQIYASRLSCCRPGLGAFERGCSFAFV